MSTLLKYALFILNLILSTFTPLEINFILGKRQSVGNNTARVKINRSEVESFYH